MSGAVILAMMSRLDDERSKACRLRYALKHVFWLWRLKVVLWNVRWRLVILGPVSDHLKVAADVLCVEIRKGLWVIFIPPDLAQESNVDCAHQLLPEDVHTVCWKGLAWGFKYRRERGT